MPANRVFGLDSLRALAILAVIFSHAGLQGVLQNAFAAVPFVAPYAGWSALTGHAGVWGVEIFFVLSGFLIGTILLRHDSHLSSVGGLAQFYTRRMWRIWPLFWLVLLGNVVFEFYFNDRKFPLGEILAHGFLIRNFSKISLSFFPESWSLAVEEWFYVFFPAVTFLLIRFAKMKVSTALLLSVFAFYTFSLVMRMQGALVPGAQWTGGQRCTVIFRWDSIMSGVAVAWCAHSYPEFFRRYAKTALWMGVAVSLGVYLSLWKFSAAGVSEAPDTFFAKTFRFTLFPLGFALLLPAASLYQPDRENFAHQSIRNIAKWSYSLYLINWPLFQLITHFERRGALGFSPTLLFAVKIAIVVVISALLYRYYESPLTRRRRSADGDLHSAPAL